MTLPFEREQEIYIICPGQLLDLSSFVSRQDTYHAQSTLAMAVNSVQIACPNMAEVGSMWDVQLASYRRLH